MTIIPPPIPVDPFTITFRGSFGRFRTESSHALQYLQSTLRAKDLGRLSTASETFDIRDIDFEELIQRDIDWARVGYIANDYLSAGQGRPIFFPPLLVCLVVLDDDGKLKPSYNGVDPERLEMPDKTKILRRTYDKDGFQLDLYETSAKFTDRTIEWEGATEPVPFLDYVAKLSVNPDRCRLVVLDGQHRLQALRQLLNNADTRAIVSNVEQPICIVWMPNAKQGDHEHIVQDLRDVFVTVNSKSRSVSGHFTLLLRDNSYAAATVRAIADAWKNDQTNGWSRLHLLEWNTREDKSTEQRLRSFSITTITIVASVLQTYLFNVSGLAPTLLKLKERETDLETADEDFDYRAMKDLARGLAVNRIVDEQIHQHLVPALNYLLRALRPYRDLEALLNTAFTEQKQQIDRGNPALASLRRYLERFIYRSDEMFDDLAKGAWDAFREKVKPSTDDRVYFLSVFQQGYIRFWLSLARMLSVYGISALDSAKAIVQATDVFAANPRHQYLNDEKLYVQRVLWRGGAVNYNSAWAKEAWTNIQVAALLRTDVMGALLKALPDEALSKDQSEAFQQEASAMALRAALSYTSRLEDEITEEIKKNLAFHFGETQAGVLRDLRVANPEAFDQEIGKVAREEFRQALDSLSGTLQLKTSQLRPVE